MIKIGDYISFDDGLATGTVKEIEDGIATIEEDSGFTVIRLLEDID